MNQPTARRLRALTGPTVCILLTVGAAGAVVVVGPERALTSNLVQDTVAALSWTVLAAIWTVRGRPAGAVLTIAAAWSVAAATGGLAVAGSPLSVTAGWICTWAWGSAVGLSYTLGVLRAARWRSSSRLKLAAVLSTAVMALGFATLPTVTVEEGVEYPNPLELPFSPALSLTGVLLTACTAFAAAAFLALQLTSPARRRQALPVLIAAIAGLAGIAVGAAANEWSPLIQVLTLPLLPIALSLTTIGTGSRTLRSVGPQLDGAADPSSALNTTLAEVARDLGVSGLAIKVGENVVASVGDPGHHRVTLLHLGRLEGFLFTPKLAGDAAEEIDAVSPSIAAVLSSARLAADVRRSRAELAVAREEERRRVRRDLHDEVGPLLAAVIAQTDVAGLALDRSPEHARESLDKARTAGSEAVTALRRISRDLHPVAVDTLGLAGALNELAFRLSGLTSVRVTAMAAASLPAAVEVAVYRLAAEAAGNAVRHAGASAVDIRLTVDRDALHLDVVDDGTGFDPTQPSAGVGLASMHQRVAELNGELSITSSSAGTAVRARIPVPD
ncbi:sensor histidine kinase [Arthrobacter sunyaminii]|uniref:histidine kinase n=1 Tax=Arthrobacter sunyaminii TaxID=2816859 RepID=A0A975S620_9MICC|nr:sensor histidine kinase [Arthrobacter sunyaminii]MBO0909676.1 sensor histidine kinase [Arthrobacter sunyaminii]QWQ36482.1 sensor histidine kinase [Arthrobacter sunyaminii]